MGNSTAREINDAFEAERSRLGRPMTPDEIAALDAKLAAPPPGYAQRAAIDARAAEMRRELEEDPSNDAAISNNLDELLTLLGHPGRP